MLKPGKRGLIYLPWRGSRRANFDWLKDVCGSRTRPEYDRDAKCFLVARQHTDHVIKALLGEYGSVQVQQYGHQKIACIQQCWDANPSTHLDCECSCAGYNHGSGHPLGVQVQPGLSVEHDYSIAEFKLTADNWTRRQQL